MHGPQVVSGTKRSAIRVDAAAKHFHCFWPIISRPCKTRPVATTTREIDPVQKRLADLAAEAWASLLPPSPERSRFATELGDSQHQRVCTRVRESLRGPSGKSTDV